MTYIILGEFAVTVCQKNKWNIPCLKASHRLKSQHSQDVNLQSGVRDMTESIFLLTWTKHKLRLMHCPSPSCWTLGHVTSFVTELLHKPQKIGPVPTLLSPCSTAKNILLSWNGDRRPDLCCCNSCCIVSALERLWANSQATVGNPDSSPYALKFGKIHLVFQRNPLISNHKNDSGWL